MIANMWRDINGYEGLYQISDTGEVKSLERTRVGKNGSTVIVTECIRKQKTDKDGYKEVALCKDGKMKYYRVHRLVAEAFLENPNDYTIINHKDENPANNNASNLEWCTQQYNRQYSLHKSSTVIECNRVIYPSIRECARVLGIDTKNIRYHLNKGTLYKGQYLFNTI